MIPRFCAHCGARLDGARFCPACGLPVAPPAGAPQGPSLQGDEPELAAQVVGALKGRIAAEVPARVDQLGRLLVSDTCNALRDVAASPEARDLAARARELDRQAGSPVGQALSLLGDLVFRRRSAS